MEELGQYKVPTHEDRLGRLVGVRVMVTELWAVGWKPGVH